MTLFYPSSDWHGNLTRIEYNCRANSDSFLCNKGVSCQPKCLTSVSLSLDDISKKTFIDRSAVITKEMTLRKGGNSSPCAVTRGILKKSISVDSASIQRLKESMMLSCSERYASSKSTSNLSVDISSSLSSCRISSSQSPPCSPQKNVTFADDNNLSLVEVRNFSPSFDCLNAWTMSSSPPNFLHQMSTSYYDKKTNFSSKSNTKLLVKKPMELLLCFNEPFTGRDFQEHFKRQNVALQTCSTRGRSVHGIVLVKNIEFEKHVSVRYTLDRWKTSQDIAANYVPNSNDGETDRFAFAIILPKDCKEMEFALRYRNSTPLEYWDNNQNRNFKVKDYTSI